MSDKTDKTKHQDEIDQVVTEFDELVAEYAKLSAERRLRDWFKRFDDQSEE
jgi:hypothetical protein